MHNCDISFAVAHEAKFTKNQQMQHIAALKCIMKYSEGIILMKITYYGSSKNHVLQSSCDANFAMNLNDRKFQSGFLLMLNEGPMAWGSWKQDCTMGSTTKAKYFVAHVVTNEITQMGKLLGDLGYGQIAPIE